MLSAIPSNLRGKWISRHRRRGYAFPVFVIGLIVLVSVALILTAK
jgi:hypothetical protein